MSGKDNIGIVIQGRMESTRLPGKVLRPIAGKPLLHRLCDRMKLAARAGALVVATSDSPSDQTIVDACRPWSVPVFRGPKKDLTTRLLGAARAYDMTALVRVTADNPLTDPEGIDAMIGLFQRQGPAFISHSGYPVGTGAELMPVAALEAYDRELSSPDDRELVFSIARRGSARHRAVAIEAPPQLRRPDYFLTVDYPEDLELLERIYAHFEDRDDMKLGEIIQFLDSHPDLPHLNRHLHVKP